MKPAGISWGSKGAGAPTALNSSCAVRSGGRLVVAAHPIHGSPPALVGSPHRSKLLSDLADPARQAEQAAIMGQLATGAAPLLRHGALAGSSPTEHLACRGAAA